MARASLAPKDSPAKAATEKPATAPAKAAAEKLAIARLSAAGQQPAAAAPSPAEAATAKPAADAPSSSKAAAEKPATAAAKAAAAKAAAEKLAADAAKAAAQKPAAADPSLAKVAAEKPAAPVHMCANFDFMDMDTQGGPEQGTFMTVTEDPPAKKQRANLLSSLPIPALPPPDCTVRRMAFFLQVRSVRLGDTLSQTQTGYDLRTQLCPSCGPSSPGPSPSDH